MILRLLARRRTGRRTAIPAQTVETPRRSSVNLFKGHTTRHVLGDALPFRQVEMIDRSRRKQAHRIRSHDDRDPKASDLRIVEWTLNGLNSDIGHLPDHTPGSLYVNGPARSLADAEPPDPWAHPVCPDPRGRGYARERSKCQSNPGTSTLCSAGSGGGCWPPDRPPGRLGAETSATRRSPRAGPCRPRPRTRRYACRSGRLASTSPAGAWTPCAVSLRGR